MVIVHLPASIADLYYIIIIAQTGDKLENFTTLFQGKPHLQAVLRNEQNNHGRDKGEAIGL